MALRNSYFLDDSNVHNMEKWFCWRTKARISFWWI